MGEREGSKAEVVDELLRDFNSRVLPLIRSEPDEARRYLRLIAWLNTWLEKMVLEGSLSPEATCRMRRLFQ